MHIPDGFIDGKTALVTGALSATGVALALRRVKRELPPRKIPLLGLAAAFLFAAQMVNFPVAGGTSGHLIGGALVAALLGPSAAVVVVTTVLIVQCFLFADGGVTALGANIFNMAIINSVGGYIIYQPISRWLGGIRGRVTALAFAGWCAAVIAAIACAGQLAWSGTVDWSVGFPAMAGTHMLIGIGEGLISALVFLAISRTRPEMIADTSEQSRRGMGVIGYGLLLSLGVAIFIAPFTCRWPDGLEHVATKLGFEHKATPSLIHAPVADYRIPGMTWAVGATAIAGVLGSLIVFAFAFLLGRMLVPKKAPEPANS
ncbi:MAG TPA: energy-coupling factor ABC transporter permease [Verrucomicrobiae bacterium]|jgi:cobalt/nickel transport system permease protein|nr:energy-coupling factor ABC transporter permease [Verrucomicrobiae bacterium]